MPKFTSVVLTWSAPREPNGVIIRYEVTYRVDSSSDIVAINTTDLSTTLTISSLTPHSRVSNISVSAYTRAGRGEAAALEDVTTLDRPRELIKSIKLLSKNPFSSSSKC